MKDKTKYKIQTMNDAFSATSNIIALAVPEFSVVPLIVFGVNRAIGLTSDEDIIKRLKSIESQLIKKRISKDKFKEKILKLSEHKRFFSSVTLENIIKNCIPETVSIYISTFIDYIMTDEYDLEEELCEIISLLNKHDFELLLCIKDFLSNGSRETYKFELEKVEKSREEYMENITKNSNSSLFRRPFYQDRSIILDENKTIFWNDFSTYCGLPKEMTLNDTLLFKSYKDRDHKFYSNWNYYGKSFIKLENCGILQLDYRNTMGTLNNINISRFHITTLGSALLKYIHLDTKDEIEANSIKE